MALTVQTRKNAEGNRLTRDAWLDAAFSAVVHGGFGQVRVLSLADGLGVTRGSFYWHFSDHADLISALVQRWQEREIALDKEWSARTAEDPRQELEALLEAAMAHAGADLQNMQFELALRSLGRQDPGIARILVAVDKARMALFQHKFLQLTGNAQEAESLAVLFYLAIAGAHQAVSRPNTTAQAKNALRQIIATHLIRRPTQG